MDQLTQVDPGVRIVFKEFPILGAGSTFAAKAALASQKQGKYLPFHDALYAFHGPITEASAMDVAKNVGLDLDRLKTDMADPTIDAALKSNIALRRRCAFRARQPLFPVRGSRPVSSTWTP